MTITTHSLLAAALALIAGCASNVPDEIRNAPTPDVQPAKVRSEPEKYRDTRVRWGGSVVSVRNLKDESQIEVVSRQLGSNGRPREEDQSDGRFLAKITGFIDPAVYATGREVTISGRLEGMTQQNIGEFPYRYPTVRADYLYLWAPRPPPQAYPDYYDPFWYDPWYPWGPWGYPRWPYYPHSWYPR